MLPGSVLVAALLRGTSSQFQDTLPPFPTDAARLLMERAAARHRVQDSLVVDYTARIRFRIALSFGRRRWALVPTVAVQEQEGVVRWEAPNDLRVDLEGMRSRARNPDWRMTSDLDTPWFVPRGLGDSIRIVGSDFPAQAAVHPLSAGGPRYYRYEPGDTLAITTADGRRLQLVSVLVTPRRTAGSLVAGRLWLDLESAEVVRFTFRYLGTDLWVAPDHPTPRDSSRARRANTWIHRILSLDADLEYALQEGRHWMPYRQVLAGRVQFPIVSEVVVPFEVVTSFSDYEINSGRPIVFHLPPPDTTRSTEPPDRGRRRNSLREERRRRLADSLSGRNHTGYWSGGRYEIHRAPLDSLRAYARWGDSLTLEPSPAEDRQLRDAQEELARLAETLPSSLTGIRRHGIGYERLADVFRYNRVQGLSAGLGYQARLPWPSFSTAFGTGRYGLTDGRLLGSVALVRDAPGGRQRLSGHRELRDADPFSSGLDLEASFRSLFFARDEADYFLSHGGAVSWERSLGRGLDLTVGAMLERQRSVATAARSAVNDGLGGSGDFAPNPPVAGGGFGSALLRLESTRGRNRWWVAADALAGEGTTISRVYGHWRGYVGGRAGATIRASAGISTEPALPQTVFRGGGLRSVRGYEYGTQRGPAFWAVQADWTPSRRNLRPVFFVDAGQATTVDRLGHTPTLIGAGVGLSAWGGLIRLDLSHPMTRRRDGLRVDIEVGAAR